jgi:hypothetical protein
MKHYSPWQFSLFRMIFGIYLTIHFAMLVPYAAELFSRDGLIGNAALNPTAGLFPNPLALDLPASFAGGFVGCLVVCALLFTVGFMRPLMAALLWFGWSALFHRNNLIGNPSIPYVGLMLALCAIVPKGEPACLGQKQVSTWAMPVWVFRAAWILLAAGYSFSGVAKCFSPSWIDGSAMSYLLTNPLARPGFMLELMQSLAPEILMLLTWATLALEVIFLPLAIWKRSRPWVWFAMILLHIGIVLVIDFADLSLGMLMIHAFTFDPNWIKPYVEKVRKLKLAFDSACLLCRRFIARFRAEGSQ